MNKVRKLINAIGCLERWKNQTLLVEENEVLNLVGQKCSGFSMEWDAPLFRPPR